MHTKHILEQYWNGSYRIDDHNRGELKKCFRQPSPKLLEKCFVGYDECLHGTHYKTPIDQTPAY